MTDASTSNIKGQWWKRKDVRKTAVLWVVLTPIIGFVATEAQVRPMGDPASEVMSNVIHLMRIFTWAAAPVAALVAAIALTALLGKRHYGDTPPADADHAIKDSPRAVATWLVGSALLCLFALAVGMVAIQKDNEALLDGDAVEINVTGQQWAWNYDYPGSKGVRSNQLHLPVNKPVVFHVTSMDVKHSFWIVQMGIKIDANPGQITETAVTPNKTGTFDIRCAELCGLLHAYMQNKVIVETQYNFDKWLASQPDQSKTTWTDQGETA
ncbi:MAG: cytochrome c oxidase subunit II [Candidatus Planktophila sp.]|jgi:cytochrome c oxidase subunit II|tara:strand:- start:7302 stop:8105 length:804 start_codon:yes stop_codon:yes gene_type:complete